MMDDDDDFHGCARHRISALHILSHLTLTITLRIHMVILTDPEPEV